MRANYARTTTGCNGVKPYALAKSNGRILDPVRSEHLLKQFLSNRFRRDDASGFLYFAWSNTLSRTMQVPMRERINTTELK